MSNPFWDAKYDREDYFYGTRPNRFLTDQRERFTPGMKALAVGDGEGRNGVWLAEQGLAVTSIDGSEVGLAKARRLAEERGVSIRTACVDFAEYEWPESEYDFVVAIFIHAPPDFRPQLHASYLRALKPGGLLILQAYMPKQIEFKTGGPPDAAMMMTADMLRKDFAGMEILHLREHEEVIGEGVGHSGESALVDLVARKVSY